MFGCLCKYLSQECYFRIDSIIIGVFGDLWKWLASILRWKKDRQNSSSFFRSLSEIFLHIMMTSKYLILFKLPDKICSIRQLTAFLHIIIENAKYVFASPKQPEFVILRPTMSGCLLNEHVWMLSLLNYVTVTYPPDSASANILHSRSTLHSSFFSRAHKT